MTDKIRKVLEDARDEIASYHIDWSRLNSSSPDYDKGYKPDYPPIVERINEVLKENP